MRVAIYHPWIYLKSGLERTILEVKRRSRHEWTILTSHYDAEQTYPELGELGVVELERVSVQRRYGAVVRAAATIATTRLDLREHDALVICCDGLGSFLNFRNRDVPSICLCFTPLRAVYDEVYRSRHLARHRALAPFALAAETAYRFLDRQAWKRYASVLCISETVKERVVRGGLYEADRLDVALVGVPDERIAPSETFEPFFFLPGRIMWTKNIELGIEAFQDFRRRTGLDYRLVVAGTVDRKSAPYFDRLQELRNADPSITFLRELSDREMDDHYRRCHAVLFTAFNEDQGLTPLEAAAHAKPVIAVNRGGPTEIVTDGETGLLVPPEPAAFSEAMESLARDVERTRSLGRGALERARSLTSRKFVDRLDDVVERTVNTRSDR